MTNAELITALRYCAEHEGCDYYIAKDCPREDTWVCGADCEQILMIDAADALEAADEKIADYTAAIDALDDSNDAYIKENERLKKRIAELEMNFSDVCNANGSLACERNELLNDVRKLEAQMPKEGEWIGEGDGYADGEMVYDMWSCSECGEYFDEWDDRPTWNYCPNCGAKMKGEQE